MSDIAWGVSGEEALALHRKGEMVKAQVLDVDVEKERISLGMKQLEGGGAGAGASASGGSASAGAGGVKKGETLTVIVRAVQDAGLDVQVGEDGAIGFIKRTELGRDRDEQRAERFQVGQKFDAQVTGFDRSKKPTFSIKALQISEEKQAVKQYGSSDSGASLGDILGAALKEKAEASAKSGKAAVKPAAEAKEPKKAKASVETAESVEAEAGEAEEAKPAKAAKPAKKAKAAAEPAAEAEAEAVADAPEESGKAKKTKSK
jgi:small subunit ribosomal protein S1